MIKYLTNNSNDYIDNYKNLYRDDDINNYDLCYYGNYKYWNYFSPDDLIVQPESGDDFIIHASSYVNAKDDVWKIFNHSSDNYIFNFGLLNRDDSHYILFQFLQEKCIKAIRFKCNDFLYGFETTLYGCDDNDTWIKLDVIYTGIDDNIDVSYTYYCNNSSYGGRYFKSNSYVIMKFNNDKSFKYYKLNFRNSSYDNMSSFKISKMILYNEINIKYPIINYDLINSTLCSQNLYNGNAENINLQNKYALFGNGLSSSLSISPYILYNFQNFSLSFCANLFGSDLSGTILSKSDDVFNISVNLKKKFHPNDLKNGLIFHAKLDESYNTYVQPENKGIPSDNLIFYDQLKSYNVAAMTQQYLYYSGVNNISYLVSENVPCILFSNINSNIKSYLNFNNCSNCTLSLWVYFDDQSGINVNNDNNIIYLGKNEKNSNESLYLIYKDNKFYVQVRDNGNYTSCLITEIIRNQWMHFCIQIQNNILKSYLNGLLVQSIQLQNNFILSDESILYINGGINLSGFDNIKIASIRIYSRSLTHLQIINLVSEFMQIDTQINQKEFICNAQTLQELQFHNITFGIKDNISCAYFKNKNENIKAYIKFSDANFPQYNNRFTLSFCCCFPHGKNDKYNSIFSYGSQYRKIGFNADNILKVSENGRGEINFNINAPKNMTHFLIMKLDNSYYCYINGELIGKCDYNDCNIYVNGIGLIGAFGNNIEELCEDCYIGQIRLYNRALSDEQINWLYEQFNHKYQQDYYINNQEDGKYNCIFTIKTKLQEYQFSVSYEEINNIWNNYVFACDYYYYYFYINGLQYFKTKNIGYIFDHNNNNYKNNFNIGCKTNSDNTKSNFITNMKLNHFMIYDYVINNKQFGYIRKNYL